MRTAIGLLWLLAGIADMGCGAALLPAVEKYCRSTFPKACRDVNYSDWYIVGSHCMKYFNTPMNFSDAEFACAKKASGGHLVSVHNEADNNGLLCIVTKYNYTHPRIWMGGFELFQSFKFIWSDGSLWDYDHWVPGQPDNTNAKEDCVEMNWSRNGLWNDDTCSKKKNFVCAFKTRIAEEK